MLGNAITMWSWSKLLDFYFCGLKFKFLIIHFTGIIFIGDFAVSEEI